MTKYLLWTKGVGNKPNASLVYEQPRIGKNGRIASPNGQGEEVIRHVKIPVHQESYLLDTLMLLYPAYGD